MATTPDPLTLGITTDVGSVANAIAAVFKAADTLIAALNTPAMQAARKNVEVQKALDKINADAKAALLSGDVTEVAEDLS